ncbi:hypothetical protein SERLA73DRAFT_148095 [Serpula lacrymans var. lacrymans S7.3]|uniref:Uncharacterized protein n=2 Tax=Serpula lacrymans var. lacrymans TaxID=341189 RepID=F8QIN8_SERL3|nr:uncharacterized protein SERLADRAFT_385423 [Serpula lacrymans var. lacrymans S7.9]EGN91840.1 hypothetical protein SERLA73DRAFT_148095 [Serpula lacrymans var. lacrymans S7.3]EGO26594.1 hypothetical protein SERLADRAFT_385423 [Serpula lacrymans var. lacrymans S7.9]
MSAKYDIDLVILIHVLVSTPRSICAARALKTQASVSSSSRLNLSVFATTWLVYLLMAVVGDNAMDWG